MKKRIVATLCVVALITTLAFSVGSSGNGNRVEPQKASHSNSKNIPSPNSKEVPEYVVYSFMFSKVDVLNERAAQLRSLGRIKEDPALPLQREANLTKEQAQSISEIASACRREIKLQDEKAETVVKAFRAQFPNGIIPKGVVPPAPPPELRAMWEERNAIVLRARDQLRAALGEETFSRLDNFAKFHFGTNTRPVPVVPVKPTKPTKPTVR